MDAAEVNVPERIKALADRRGIDPLVVYTQAFLNGITYLEREQREYERLMEGMKPFKAAG